MQKVLSFLSLLLLSAVALSMWGSHGNKMAAIIIIILSAILSAIQEIHFKLSGFLTLLFAIFFGF